VGQKVKVRGTYSIDREARTPAANPLRAVGTTGVLANEVKRPYRRLEVKSLTTIAASCDVSLKKVCISSRHSASRTPPVTSTRWLCPGSSTAPDRRDDRAGSRLRRTIDQHRDPRVDQRADTHQTRLDGDAQHRAGQAVVADPVRRLADRHDLRVRGRVARRDRLVEAAPDDRAIQRDNGAIGTSPASRARRASSSARSIHASDLKSA